MQKSDLENLGCGPLVALFSFVIAIAFTIGAICWPYTLNTWLDYFGKDPGIVWWQGGLIGLVPILGQLSIPGVVITWLLMMFM